MNVVLLMIGFVVVYILGLITPIDIYIMKRTKKE